MFLRKRKVDTGELVVELLREFRHTESESESEEEVESESESEEGEDSFSPAFEIWLE
jgi:hypothetical protein